MGSPIAHLRLLFFRIRSRLPDFQASVIADIDGPIEVENLYPHQALGRVVRGFIKDLGLYLFNRAGNRIVHRRHRGVTVHWRRYARDAVGGISGGGGPSGFFEQPVTSATATNETLRARRVNLCTCVTSVPKG